MFSIIATTIPPRIQALAIAGSLILLWIVVNLMRREKLKEGYSIIWFLVGLSLVVFSAFTRLLDMLAQAVGISYSPAALFLILTSGLFLLALHFSVLISKHDQRIRYLAQENALLKNKISTLAAKEPGEKPAPTKRLENDTAAPVLAKAKERSYV